MRKISLSCAIIFMLVCLASQGRAASIGFDFEDGTSRQGVLQKLKAYMQSEFSQRLRVSKRFRWLGEAPQAGNDAVALGRMAGIIDFDPGRPEDSNYKITSIAFDWDMNNRNVKNLAFGFDVYDDITGKWYSAYDARTHGAASGSTGLITFDDDLEVTMIRIHRQRFNRYFLIDNLTITDNREVAHGIEKPGGGTDPEGDDIGEDEGSGEGPVVGAGPGIQAIPEPGTLILVGSAAIGFMAYRSRSRKP